MANIKIALDYTIIDGQPLSFKAPCDCTAVTGIKVEYPDGESTTSTEFSFADAHGTDLAGLGNLFAAGAMVRVLLDTVSNKAYIQNADTNAYLEAQLGSKAPAGYGLGEAVGTYIVLGDANTAVRCGWYRVHTNTLNCVGYVGLMRVDGYSASNFVQTVYQFNRTDGLLPTMQRHCANGIFSEWCWVNPPLLLNTEYRTTEMFEGKPVYAKRLNFTTGVNGTKKIELDAATDSLVRIEGYWYYTSDPSVKHFFDTAPFVNYITTGKLENVLYLYVNTGETATAWTGCPVIYYTKS